jgi:SAM-dependent methyltransferase
MLLYTAFNKDVYNQIPDSAINILDVGCGNGALGQALKNNNANRKVTGLTFFADEAKMATELLDSVVEVDLNGEAPIFTHLFDCIIFSHVLEHTYNPVKVLKHFKQFLSNDGVIVVALPNILYYKQRFKFLKGEFKYSLNGGLMDITHFRFFDWNTAHELVIQAGLNPIIRNAYGNFPLGVLRRLSNPVAETIDNWAIQVSPGLFGFQFIIVSKLN